MTKRSPTRPTEPERRNHAVRVADIVPAVGDKAFRRFGFIQSSVVSRWAEIVGARYAAVSAPESIRFPAGKRADGVLRLTVEGAHGPMMQHVAPTIVERVNRFFGYTAVSRVSIRTGSPLRRPAVARPTAPDQAQVPVEMGDSLRAVSDPELRAVLESLAAGVARSSGLPRVG
ncbi:hypothetical protein GGR88_002658 [Sphingomonas jejuensis]|uniref:DUF721 domain-containing protein n=1 Tax=Sphingomonas jejuensis TaxID=904715 RepID=A0ABX0XP38_9SPHN|nr:DciA family protein [Sphingomonas jejuensis]NJC35144.1 hypothetical protein [Sphingomonas jejuensis]